MDPEEAIARLFASRNQPQPAAPPRPTYGEMLADAIDDYVGRNRLAAIPAAPAPGPGAAPASGLVVNAPAPLSDEGPPAETGEYTSRTPNAGFLSDPAVLAAEANARAASHMDDPNLRHRSEQGFQAWQRQDGSVFTVADPPGAPDQYGLISSLLPPNPKDFPGGDMPDGGRLLIDYHTHPFVAGDIDTPNGRQRLVGTQTPSQADIDSVWRASQRQTWDNHQVVGVVEGADGQLYYFGPNAPGTVWREPPAVADRVRVHPIAPLGPFARPPSFTPGRR
jgi:hypothetical protein